MVSGGKKIKTLSKSQYLKIVMLFLNEVDVCVFYIQTGDELKEKTKSMKCVSEVSSF